MENPDAQKIIEFFYPEDTRLRRLLLAHSEQVCGKALEILHNPSCNTLNIQEDTVRIGALLHDIGIGHCHAPSIFCEGTEPYLAHGLIGGAMLRAYGKSHHIDMERFARICERHTGAGITACEIREHALPLPERDLLPETPEEKLVCLADKFFSKSGDLHEKSIERICRSMEKFGPGPLARFDEMCRLFGIAPARTRQAGADSAK